MIIGILKIELHILASSSLKDKRRVLKGLKEKIRNRFNVSVAEVDNHDKWQRATVGIACLGQDKCSVNSVLDTILNFIRSVHEIELGNFQIELL